MEAALPVWARDDADPRVVFEGWAHAFLLTFDATHPSSSPRRAAAILRSRLERPLDLDQLASEVGASRSALTRSFRQQYGMSLGEYLTTIKLRWFIEEVRKPASNATRLAESVGYGSYHNLSWALVHRTGFTCTEIRRLTHSDIVDLFSMKLPVSALPNRIHARRRRPAARRLA